MDTAKIVDFHVVCTYQLNITGCDKQHITCAKHILQENWKGDKKCNHKSLISKILMVQVDAL